VGGQRGKGDRKGADQQKNWVAAMTAQKEGLQSAREKKTACAGDFGTGPDSGAENLWGITLSYFEGSATDAIKLFRRSSAFRQEGCCKLARK